MKKLKLLISLIISEYKVRMILKYGDKNILNGNHFKTSTK